MKPPLLVELALLGSSQEPVHAHCLPVLAGLYRAGIPLVLLDERPTRWAPTRNRVDRAFDRQARIEADIRRGGGTLDAVVYLDLGMFTRKREFERVLADLANRYGCRLGDFHALVRPGKIAEAIQPHVGLLERIEAGQLEASLRQLL
ncbi:MAG: hypothetical protein ACNA7E_07990 [Wenzhouxiangellaceae bacterium]